MLRLLISGLVLSLLGCSGNQQEPEAGALVSTQWLLERIDDPSNVILYIGSRDTFDSIHIRQSRYISAREFMIDIDSLRHELFERKAVKAKEICRHFLTTE